MTTSYKEKTMDPIELRRSLGAFPTGVVLIAAELGGKAGGTPAPKTVGMLANSFGSVSLDPPLVQVSFAHTSTTWPVLREAQELAISVLSADNLADAEALRRPAGQRFEGIGMQGWDGQAQVLPGAAAQFRVRLYEEIAAGDHTIALFEVLDHRRDELAAPLHFVAGHMFAR
ncbi:flavin reductase family protein [Corynebacterium lizhenjunii]|uniref:Flavin reductase family protein n=1 Tax=Corynebacterium lizhenjunii TaxID=2709394 RepID=A0A7T0PCH6_9CORY|nr:flavin reductase family protein [Corynebacterium lizhenjunii]QPK79742.1 flavin reductase family protein [Corynebacterium lizhenjunii]